MNLIAERMQRFFDHIFLYYDLLLPKGSDEITKRLQMLLNNPKYGRKKAKKSHFFGEITIKASPPIYMKKISHLALGFSNDVCPQHSKCSHMRLVKHVDYTIPSNI